MGAEVVTANTPAPEPASNWASVTGRIAAAIDKELSPGDVAELRRLSPREVGGAAFWRIVASILEPRGMMPAGERGREKAERRWSVLLAAMALLRGMHAPGRSLGAALAEAGYSELRLVRLLRAHDAALFDAIRGAAHYLASRGQPVDCTDFVRLVLTDGSDGEDAVRRRIARSYYAAVREEG